MISIPKDFQNNPLVDRKFRALVEYFNELEKQLEDPSCASDEDSKRILARAQNELIMRGVL
jgi:hypothetical protein